MVKHGIYTDQKDLIKIQSLRRFEILRKNSVHEPMARDYKYCALRSAVAFACR